jgi:nicotinate-nucleotide pyrophosphorylase (carboxylating)
MSPNTPYPLENFVNLDQLRLLFRAAKHEDLSEQGDISSELLIEPGASISAEFRTRAAGVVCGANVLPLLVKTFTDRIRVDIIKNDSELVEAGCTIARVSGTAKHILSAERTALNLLTHLSGIASLTACYVETAARLGGTARICDTRKTHLGLRGLEKYAVSCGGGLPHRKGLYDAVLWKDNHIAHIGLENLERRITEAVEEGVRMRPKPAFFQIEVDTLEQLEIVLKCPIDMVLLDNMSLEDTRSAVKLRDSVNPKIKLESSGGISLEKVADVSATGVDRISIGELTHSAPALDIGLDILE